MSKTDRMKKKNKTSKFAEKGIFGLLDMFASLANYDNRMVNRLEPIDEKIGLSMAWVDDFECFELAILGADKVYDMSKVVPSVAVIVRSENESFVQSCFDEWLKRIEGDDYPDEIKYYDQIEYDKFETISKYVTDR